MQCLSISSCLFLNIQFNIRVPNLTTLSLSLSLSLSLTHRKISYKNYNTLIPQVVVFRMAAPPAVLA